VADEYNKDEAEKNIEETLAKLNDDSLSDEEKEQLSQKALNDYSAALRSEFEVQQQTDPENTPEYTRKFFREHIGIAAAQVVSLATNSDKDSVRLAASKLIINWANEDAIEDGDPMKKLLQELTAPKKAQPTESEVEQ
jgi:uridylate kinase